MIGAFQSEPCYAALYSLLSQAQLLTNGKPNGTAAFVTTGRQAQPVSDVAAAMQPALYMMEGEIDFNAEEETGASVDAYHSAAIVYFTNPGGSAAASPQLNALRDALIYAMRQQTIGAAGAIVPLQLGQRQELGGLCFHATFHGKALANEGLQNNQGACIFPITIFTGV